MSKRAAPVSENGLIESRLYRLRWHLSGWLFCSRHPQSAAYKKEPPFKSFLEIRSPDETGIELSALDGPLHLAAQPVVVDFGVDGEVVVGAAETEMREDLPFEARGRRRGGPLVVFDVDFGQVAPLAEQDQLRQQQGAELQADHGDGQRGGGLAVELAPRSSHLRAGVKRRVETEADDAAGDAEPETVLPHGPVGVGQLEVLLVELGAHAGAGRIDDAAEIDLPADRLLAGALEVVVAEAQLVPAADEMGEPGLDQGVVDLEPQVVLQVDVGAEGAAGAGVGHVEPQLGVRGREVAAERQPPGRIEDGIPALRKKGGTRPEKRHQEEPPKPE